MKRAIQKNEQIVQSQGGLSWERYLKLYERMNVFVPPKHVPSRFMALLTLAGMCFVAVVLVTFAKGNSGAYCAILTLALIFGVLIYLDLSRAKKFPKRGPHTAKPGASSGSQRPT